MIEYFAGNMHASCPTISFIHKMESTDTFVLVQKKCKMHAYKKFSPSQTCLLITLFHESFQEPLHNSYHNERAVQWMWYCIV